MEAPGCGLGESEFEFNSLVESSQLLLSLAEEKNWPIPGKKVKVGQGSGLKK